MPEKLCTYSKWERPLFTFIFHIDVEACVGVPKSTIADIGLGLGVLED